MAFEPSILTLVSSEKSETVIPFLKAYTVFKHGADRRLARALHHLTRAPPQSYAAHRTRRALHGGARATIRHGGSIACYVLGHDEVRLPPFESFRDAESYYATLAHELTHWTRHPSRLDRDLGRKRFVDEGYAMEELVAELGSAFVCADLDLTPEPRPDHASYIASWLKVLRNDRRAILAAASHAQLAADHLHHLQRAQSPQLRAAV